MSVLTYVPSSDVISLFNLWRMIYKFTFDKKNCSYRTQSMINEHLLQWADILQFQQRLHKESDIHIIGQKEEDNNILDMIVEEHGTMCLWVVKEEKGELEHLKETYARSKIDYRLADPMCKVFPECQKLRNFKRGQAALEQAQKDNPQDYIKGE